MNVEVICGSDSIDGELSRIFLNRQEPNIPEELIQNPLDLALPLVRASVLDSMKKSRALFAAGIDHLRVEVADDLARIRPEVLGCFDPYKTRTTGTPCFSISAHMLYDALCEAYGLGDPMPFIKQQNVWLHELVHLADWQQIEMFSRLREDAADAALSRMEDHFAPRYNDPDSVLSREWQFLQALEGFRAEGLANLFEGLVAGTLCHFPDMLAASSLFSGVMHPFLQKLVRGKGPGGSSQGISEVDFTRGLEMIRESWYTAGPGFVLDALIMANPAWHALRKIAESIGRTDMKLPPEEAAGIVRPGIDMDLGQFLFYATQPSSTRSWPSFLTPGSLFSVAHYVSMPDAEYGEYWQVIEELSDPAGTHDRDSFIRGMKRIVGARMDSEEIDREFQQLQARPEPAFGIARETARRTEDVYRIWQSCPDEVLGWALTFVLDPEDMINDAMPYIGYLDDLFVLEKAFALGEVEKKIAGGTTNR